MRAVLSNFSFSVPFSFIGLGIKVKIITAVVAVIVAAGGVVYTLSQKSYAAQTINFDGQEFVLVSERFKDTGKMINVFDASAARYVAAYAGSDNHTKPDLLKRFLYNDVFYDANPKSEFIQNGVFSAKAYKRKDWQEVVNDPLTYLYQVRESSGDDITQLFVYDPDENGKDLRLTGNHCVTLNANAISCIYYRIGERNDQYATAKEWAEKEGAAHLERMYELLTAYPLAHNEELLADMKLAVEGQL